MEISFRPEDLPLRRDVRVLGELLGNLLKRLSGVELFDRVESARRAARERRRGEAEAEAEARLTELLSGLDPDLAIEVTRAFSSYFGLVNMAERVHRIRRRRDYLRRREAQPGSFHAVVQTLKDAGVGADRLKLLVSDLQFVPVLTAHPTEATRRTLLKKEQRIARALVDRIDPDLLTPREERAALGRVADEVSIGWQTDELASRPGVADEVEHVTFFLSDVIYRVVPAVYRSLSEAVATVYGPEAVPELPPGLLRFGSWVGGDMDGNPHAGPDTIRSSLSRQRELILRLYRGEVRELFEHLSHSDTRVTVLPAVRERVELYRSLLPDSFEEIPERYRSMPYRVLLWLISARLDRTEARGEGRYEVASELLEDLALILACLDSHGGTGRYRVERLIRRVQTFGFHLATLDVRQDALEHRRAVAEALGRPAFVELPERERIDLLREALGRRDPVAGNGVTEGASSLARCLAVMRAIGECRRLHGPEALGVYIISMAQGPDDALAVLYLARRAGLLEGDGEVPLDIVPLFETVSDLRNAGPALRSLLAERHYRAHLRSRNDAQMVMIGFSDSSKESGLAAARWALHRAQTDLLDAARTSAGGPVRMTLFYGRGGTISRGGGKPRNGILAEPPGAIRGQLRLTEQGEIISMKYGLRDIALRTIELSLGAVLERALGERVEAEQAGTEAAALIADRSRSEYRRLVHDEEMFFPYFRAATPIDVIERLPIGSRPPSRRDGGGIESLRAIPWVFAWTQSRHLLPGWYGMGSGLSAAAARFGIGALREMARGWPFFANLLADTEMVLAKADLNIARLYAELAGRNGETLFPRILEEFELTRRLVCEIQEIDNPLDRDPVLQRSILLRNPYVDPMSFLQVDFLRRWRAGGRKDPELERVLLITVKGIARGMQNTG